MKDNWVGAIMSVLFVCGFITIVILICIILGLKNDYDEILAMCRETEEKVERHERIMKAYEFYNWHYSLKMFEEEEKQK